MSKATRFIPKKLTPELFARLLQAVENTEGLEPLEQSRIFRALAQVDSSDVESLRLSVAASVLADLSEQGWTVRIEEQQIALVPPSGALGEGETVQKVKERIRRGLMVASDRQIATNSVQDFIRSMERERPKDGVKSILCLIDDGDDLASKLKISVTDSEEESLKRLSRHIKPVVQVCDPGLRCEHSGHRLLDIWRYFRHTWALEYNSVPGRTMRFLIRNSARPNAPVIGIAMLASAAANYYVRDHWIGWRVDDVIDNILADRWAASSVARELVRAVDDAVADIRTDDLLSVDEVREPDDHVFFKLEQLTHRAVQKRRDDLIGRHARSGETGISEAPIDIRCVNKEEIAEETWKSLSETSLYVKKRSEQLLQILRCRRFFRDNDFLSAPGAALCEALLTKEGKDYVALALNELRKRKLATEVADLSVCGAIEPYNHLLGGKLVALLMASREVREAYRRRYEGQISEIASQMAGKAIQRPADLKVLTTTSLYGIGSSQYNRLVLRKGQVPKLTDDVWWKELERTQGVTVTHLSKLTVRYMQKLAEAYYGTRRVNSVFGEGSSPRTRQIREGLNLIGIASDNVLKQGLTRRVYACEMYPGAKNDLHAFVKVKGKRKSPSSAVLAKAWLSRWIVKRAVRDDVLKAIEASGPQNVSKQLRERAARALAEKPREKEALAQLKLDL